MEQQQGHPPLLLLSELPRPWLAHLVHKFCAPDSLHALAATSSLLRDVVLLHAPSVGVVVPAPACASTAAAPPAAAPPAAPGAPPITDAPEQDSQPWHAAAAAQPIAACIRRAMRCRGAGRLHLIVRSAPSPPPTATVGATPAATPSLANLRSTCDGAHVALLTAAAAAAAAFPPKATAETAQRALQACVGLAWEEEDGAPGSGVPQQLEREEEDNSSPGALSHGPEGDADAAVAASGASGVEAASGTRSTGRRRACQFRGVVKLTLEVRQLRGRHGKV